MRFVPDLSETQAPQVIERCLAISNVKLWEKRAAWLRSEIKRNEYLRDYLADRFPLEWSFAILEETKGQLLEGQALAHYRRFALFSAAVAWIFEQLNGYGQKQLIGKLRKGLSTEEGLASLELELVTGVHLMTKGFDVVFHDMETGGGFDLLAASDGAELEVECKLVSGDLGRQVHRRRAVEFFARVLPRLKGVTRSLRGGMSLRIVVNSKLSGAESQLKAIEARVVEAILRQEDLPQNGVCAVRQLHFSLEGTPFHGKGPPEMSEADLRSYCKRNFGIGNEHFFVTGAPPRLVLIVAIESERQNWMLNRLFRTLKESAERQCTGKRPALLCAKFFDVGPLELRELGENDRTGTGYPGRLQIEVSEFLQSAKRQHVHSVAFLSNMEVVPSVEQGTQNSREVGAAYVFRNPYHPQADDLRLRPFSV